MNNSTSGQSVTAAPESCFFRTPPEIDLRIFQCLSSFHDAESLGQVSRHFRSIWTGHSEELVPKLVRQNIECAEQAGSLARYQMSVRRTWKTPHLKTPHLRTIQYAKRVDDNDTLAQIAVVRFSSDKFCEYLGRGDPIPFHYPFTHDERQRFIGAFYRTLFMVTIILKYTVPGKEHELPVKLRKYLALWSAKEMEESLIILWWIELLGIRIPWPPSQFIDSLFRSFGKIKKHLLGFHRVLARAIAGSLSYYSSFLREPDRYFTLDKDFEENQFPKEKLVGEIFKEMAIRVNVESGSWWAVPGLWKLHGPGYWDFRAGNFMSSTGLRYLRGAMETLQNYQISSLIDTLNLVILITWYSSIECNPST